MYSREKKKKKQIIVTWIPARDEREIGLFLSLSLSLFAAVVFAARSPFPPFPAIAYLHFSELTFQEKEHGEIEETRQRRRKIPKRKERIKTNLGSEEQTSVTKGEKERDL